METFEEHNMSQEDFRSSHPLDVEAKHAGLLSQYDNQRVLLPPSRTPTSKSTTTVLPSRTPTAESTNSNVALLSQMTVEKATAISTGHKSLLTSLWSFLSQWRGKEHGKGRRTSSTPSGELLIEDETERSAVTHEGRASAGEPVNAEAGTRSTALEKASLPLEQHPPIAGTIPADTSFQSGPEDDEFIMVPHEKETDPHCGNSDQSTSHNEPSLSLLSPIGAIFARQEEPGENDFAAVAEQPLDTATEDHDTTESDMETWTNSRKFSEISYLSDVSETQPTNKGVKEPVGLDRQLQAMALLANRAANDSGYFPQPAVPYPILDKLDADLPEESEMSINFGLVSDMDAQGSSRTSPTHDSPKEGFARDLGYNRTGGQFLDRPARRLPSIQRSPASRRNMSWRSGITSSPSRDENDPFDRINDELASGISDFDFEVTCIGNQFVNVGKETNMRDDHLDDVDKDDIRIVEKRRRDLESVITLSASMGPGQATAFEDLLDPDIPSRSLGHSIAYWMLQRFVRSWLELSRFIFVGSMERISSLLGHVYSESVVYTNWFCDGTFVASYRRKSTGQRRVVSSVHPSISSASDDIPRVFQQIYAHDSGTDSGSVEVYRIVRRSSKSGSAHRSPAPGRALRSGYSSHRQSFSSSASEMSNRSIAPSSASGNLRAQPENLNGPQAESPGWTDDVVQVQVRT